MKNKIYLLLTITTLFLSSCEDRIKVDLEEGEPILVVDAFLTNDPGKQTIKLFKSANYFYNEELPPATGATVTVTDVIGRTFNFTDPDNDGRYEWIPDPLVDFIPLGVTHDFYTLNIKYEGEEYSSNSYMDTVPKIDSLYYEFLKEEVIGGDTLPAGYRLIMDARDVPGEGNCYWFKTSRNGLLYNKASQINLAYDAAFGPGSDGVEFIAPIEFGLSPERYQVGDTALVECYSIGIGTYFFLTRLQAEMQNTGLFATPSSNLPTNITNKNKDGKKVFGWFTTASVSRNGVRIK